MNQPVRIVALLLVASCNTAERADPALATPVDSAQTAGRLEDVSWSLTWLNGQPVTATDSQPAPTLVLSSSQRRASGNTGCNQFSGEYELDRATLRFGAMIATRRACIEPAFNQREHLLLQALTETRTWQITADTLILMGATGQLARFEGKSPTPH